MRRILLLFILLSIPGIIAAQSCLPNGITFTSQSQIDSFAINYPSCQEVEGSISIQGADITNLNGLSSLTGIGGGLLIENNPELTSLDGLENVSYIGDGLYIGSIIGNPVLKDISGLSGINSLGFHLTIINNDALKSLSGLEGITEIKGLLKIHLNDSLPDLHGLDNLTKVIYSVDIEGNNTLLNLMGLGSLDSISNTLIVNNNPALSSLLGLNKLVMVGVDLTITYNDALLEIGGLNNLQYIGKDLTIRNNPLLESITDFEVLSYVGDLIDIHFNPGLKSLSGFDNLTSVNALFIGANSLNTLEGLHNVSSIHSLMSICEDSLVDFTDLSSLTEAGGIGVCGHSLTSLNGLENIVTTGQVWIGYSTNLQTLSGLHNLVACNGSFTISENESLSDLNGVESLNFIFGLNIMSSNLTSLKGLNNVTTITRIDFKNNPYLYDLSALSNVNSGGHLAIYNNPALISLSGLDNIDPQSLTELAIHDNPLLSTCEVQSICDYIESPGGSIIINNNAPGCDSQEEVEEACGINAINEETTENDTWIYPNPVHNKMWIRCGIPDAGCRIVVYNSQGVLVKSIQVSDNQEVICVDLSSMAGGLYIVEMLYGDKLIRKKIIKN